MESMLDPSELGDDAIRRLSRVEFERLVEIGFFDEDEHVELLRGWLVRMSPAGPVHAAIVARLTEALVLALAGRAEVRPQSSFAAAQDSEPEPDVAVVPRGLTDRHPSTAYLLVEVSDSSLRKDRRLKAPVYAEAGVPEYWIVNVQDRCLEIHREPVAGRYARVERVPESGSVTLVAFSEVTIPVSQILPPRR